LIELKVAVFTILTKIIDITSTTLRTTTQIYSRSSYPWDNGDPLPLSPPLPLPELAAAASAGAAGATVCMCAVETCAEWCGGLLGHVPVTRALISVGLTVAVAVNVMSLLL
jgi:hypothetical protein